ncbi:S24 family peptidase [Citrobacter freundii]
MFPGQCGNTAFFFKSQPDQFHFEFRGIVFPGKSFFSAHEVSTCKISGCLSYRILDSGPDGTQTTLTDDLCIRYPESTYLVRAEGDSMLNAGIKDGDLLIVECIREARHGDIVIAAVDGEFTCKRLQLLPSPALVPANPAYSSIPLTEDIETVVFGVVRHLVHSFKFRDA